MPAHSVRVLVAGHDAKTLTLSPKASEPAVSPPPAVVQTGSVDKALRVLANESFDVLLLDLALPGTAGTEALQRVQSIAPNLPIVILYDTPDDEQAIAKVREGAEACVVKTASDSQLIHVLHQAIHRKQTEVALRESESRYRALFQYSPISLWEQDLSSVKAFVEKLRRRGIRDLRSYLHAHPQSLRACAARVRTLRVNRHTLSLYGASSEQQLMQSLPAIFGKASYPALLEALCALSGGQTSYTGTAVTYRLDGTPNHLQVSLAVAPGYESTWSKVFMSLLDITETRKAQDAQKALLQELHERVKELHCLYGVSQLMAQQGNSLDDVLQRTVELIPAAMQRPEATCARIVFDGREYKTDNFRDTSHKLTSAIQVPTGEVTLEVCCLGRRPRQVTRLFIPQEAALLDTVSRELKNVIEARCAEESLRKARDDLEARVVRRTRELLTANRSLRREVQDRKEAETLLKQAMARIEANDKAKSQFVSNVSHELRTPLSSMSYALENLSKGILGELPDRIRSYIVMLSQDCERLKETVDEILDLSRLEAHTMVLRKVTLPFEQFVRQTVESLDLQAQNEDIRLATAIGGQRFFVAFDPHKIERSILNVVQNAIKYTPAGGHVDVRLYRDPDDPAKVTLDVEDDGIGIESKYLSRVTERYFRIGEQTSGTGLGLALCKDIVELHGGRIRLTSPPPNKQKGTLVSILLPLAASPRVLVLAGTPRARRRLRDHLRNHEYQVTTRLIDERAVSTVSKLAPDVLIVDLLADIPERMALLAALKTDKVQHRLPMLAVAGVELDRCYAKLLEGFGVTLVPESWNRQELLQRIDDTLFANLYTRKEDGSARPASQSKGAHHETHPAGRRR